ncbi:DUF222 domain-containing protein [Gordonia humi]|uniref:DUF222 domain-containing protein n=1 Tax=Gordonia humi TaxID=686429 RepID=UPI00361AD0F2
MSNRVFEPTTDSALESRVDLLFAKGTSAAGAARGLDAVGDTDHLAALLAHYGGVRAAADYSILATASHLAEACEEEYLVAMAAHREQVEATAAGFTEAAARAAAGEDPFSRYGPTGDERAIAQLGAAFNCTPGLARRLIESGHALRYRFPETGALLAAGRIDKPRFDAVVSQASLVADEKIVDFDATLAEAIASRPAMGFQRFAAMVDATIAAVDPEALELRKENVARDRGITVRPDRRVPGRSRVSGRLTTEGGATFDAALDGLAAAVHADDPRTKAQLRADAVVALAQGTTLDCGCDACVAAPGPTTPAPAPLAAGWFHIVVNMSTLVGADDAPAYIDGHGVVDAETARGLLAEAKRSYVHADAATPDGLTYTPSPRVADLVRCGDLWCSWPGCDAPRVAVRSGPPPGVRPREPRRRREDHPCRTGTPVPSSPPREDVHRLARLP